MSKGRIRSGNQRRILDWLADGGGTVSQISEHLELRMPHASLALRQLRDSGDVSREDQAGIRGAVHRMTTSGRERLRQDSLHKISKYIKQIPTDSEFILLSRDNSTLLLGYVNEPSSALIQLPKVTHLDNNDASNGYNGNQGGRWAIARGNAIMWYDIETLQPVEAPIKTDTGTLVNWSQQRKIIGLVSAKLLDSSKPWNISEGAWLKSPTSKPQLPPILANGEYVLGLAAGDIEISPPLGIHGHYSSLILRSLTLSSLSQDAIVIGELRENEAPRILPIAILRQWLLQRHPRLDQERLNEKWNTLYQYHTENNSSSPSIATKRELLSDFGNVQWSNEDVNRIDLRGVSENGANCIYNWILSQPLQFVGEWNWPIQNNMNLLRRLLSSSKCRAMITTKGDFIQITKSNLLLFKGERMAQLNLQLDRGINLPITLTGHKKGAILTTSSKFIPANANELSQYLSGQSIEQSFTLRSDEKTSSEIWRAIESLPQGDADLANSVERKNPLAAWISSPIEDKIRCWQRIGAELEDGWSDLLPIELCDNQLLVTACAKASPQWMESAIEQLKFNFIINNQSIIEVEHLLKDNRSRPFLATAILLASETLSSEFFEIVASACKIWLDAPRFSSQVLQALFPLGKDLDPQKMQLAMKCARASQSHPRDSLLAVWGELFLRLQSGVSISIDLVRKSLQVLPHTWWSAWSSQWLQMQLSASSSRRWLSENYLPWPALICRVKGERVGIPAHPVEHKGIDVESDSLLHILLLENGSGKEPLLDLYDLVINAENDNPIHNGRIHPLVGYLGKPVQSWPSIPLQTLQQYDADVSALLYAMSFRQRIEQ